MKKEKLGEDKGGERLERDKGEGGRGWKEKKPVCARERDREIGTPRG